VTRPAPLRPEPSVMDGAVSAVFGRRQSILEMSSRNAFPVIQQKKVVNSYRSCRTISMSAFLGVGSYESALLSV